MTPLSYLLTRQSLVTAGVAPKEEMGGVPTTLCSGGERLSEALFSRGRPEAEAECIHRQPTPQQQPLVVHYGL